MYTFSLVVIPIYSAIDSAVSLMSPVIIITLIPALVQTLMASGTYDNKIIY